MTVYPQGVFPFWLWRGPVGLGRQQKELFTSRALFGFCFVYGVRRKGGKKEKERRLGMERERWQAPGQARGPC